MLRLDLLGQLPAGDANVNLCKQACFSGRIVQLGQNAGDLLEILSNICTDKSFHAETFVEHDTACDRQDQYTTGTRLRLASFAK